MSPLLQVDKARKVALLIVLDKNPLEPSAKQYPFTPPACGELGNDCDATPGINELIVFPVAGPNVEALL